MTDKKPHYALEFASRYGSGRYLNAWTALTRLDELLEDAVILKDHLDKVEPKENRWAPWFGLEIISYYAVGFVTCLEWHARSRLVDFLTFAPSAVKSDDLKVVKDRVVVEMLAANLTVASLVGGATNISSLEEYLGVFSRLLSFVDPRANGFKAIFAERSNTGKPWVEKQEVELLKNLFYFRNGLVHEIGIDRVGHQNIRDSWDPAEAIRMGLLVKRVIQALEASISATMQPGFPNVLDADGVPLSEWRRLEGELTKLEWEIGRMTTSFTENETGTDENWEFAKVAAANYLAKEMLFLDQASMFHNRYVEMREPLRLALIRSRHAYLKDIIRMIHGVWEIKESSESTSTEEKNDP